MVSSGDTDPPTTKQIPQAKHTSSKLSPVKKAGRSGLFSADFTPKSMTTPPQAGNWDLSKVLTIASQADDDVKRSGKDESESGNPVFRGCVLCVGDDTLDFPQDMAPGMVSMDITNLALTAANLEAAKTDLSSKK